MAKLKKYKSRKIHPSVPKRDGIALSLFDDNCWMCKCRDKCGSCPTAKAYNEQKRRKTIKKMRKDVLKDYD